MDKKKSNINLGNIVGKLLSRKGLLARNLIIAAVVSVALILCVPRYYTCELSLAPELGNVASGGSLASIASSFGISVGGDVQSDAISPSLYPDLMESKEFLVSLFPVRVKSQDGTIDTDYYTYLKKHQKKPWWNTASKWLKNSIKGLFSKPKPKAKSDYKNANPFRLSEDEYNMAEAISRKITCSVDRRNFVITIRVQDQDPLIAATMADSVRCRLQNFIIKYRTSKARVDVDYYERLLAQAKSDYDKALRAYSIYADSHRDMILQTYISQRDNLENDMQMAFNVYTAVSQQLEAAKAKLQESTPAFTILKCASVPVIPTGPRRAVFVLGMLILTFFVTALYIMKAEDFKKIWRSSRKSGTKAAKASPQAEPATDNAEAAGSATESDDAPVFTEKV